MSNFIMKTKNPNTGEWENAEWLDDYFGGHRYGVRFSDGHVVNADAVKFETDVKVIRDDATEADDTEVKND